MTLLLFHSNILQRLDRSTRAPRSPLTGRGDLNTIIKLNPKPKTKPEGERSPLLVQETVRVVQQNAAGMGREPGGSRRWRRRRAALLVSRSSPDPYAYNAGGEARVTEDVYQSCSHPHPPLGGGLLLRPISCARCACPAR